MATPGKKIGVITFLFSHDNYGQYLQAWALQQVLREAGHDPFVIRYNHKTNHRYHAARRRKLLMRLATPWSTLLHLFKKTGSKPTATLPDRRFVEFRDRRLSTTPLLTDTQLRTTPPEAECYICGSDQIWKTTIMGLNEHYYLGFAPDSARKIAYAPSFGGCRFTKSQQALGRKLLQRFDSISVRERAGVDLCRMLGRDDAVQLPDPTLLLTAGQYSAIASAEARPRERYLLLYLLNADAFDLEPLYRFAASRGLEVVYVPSQGAGGRGNHPKTAPTIEQWLGLMEGAEFVITNSFHGTIFAVLFHRPFLALMLSGARAGTNDRLETLLETTGLGSQAIWDTDEASLQGLAAPLPWDNVEATLARERTRATEWLLKAIDK